MTYTSQDAAADYSEISAKLARAISQIAEIKNRCQFISDQMKDNDDPAFELGEALEKLGVALASAVTYGDEYAKEAAGKAPAENESDKGQKQ